MSIGAKVRAARKAARISQEEVARRAGVSLNVINRLERGVILDPHYSTLRGIAHALGVPVEVLIREEELTLPLDEAQPSGPEGISASEEWAMRQIVAGNLIIDVALPEGEDESGAGYAFSISIEDLLSAGAAPHVERLVASFVKDGGRVCVSYDPERQIREIT